MWAQFGATLQFLLVAIFGALALPPSAFAGGADILSVIDSPKAATWGVWHASRIMTYIFPIANILTSIPVFSIIVRYNLLSLKGVKIPVWIANFLAVVLPWIVTLPFYVGDSLDLVINWSSAVFFVALNLLFPVTFWVSTRWAAQKGFPAFEADDEESPSTFSASGTIQDDSHEDRMYLLNYSSMNNNPGAVLDDETDADGADAADRIDKCAHLPIGLFYNNNNFIRANPHPHAHAHATPPLPLPSSYIRSIPVLPWCCASKKSDLTYAYVLFIFSVIFGVVSFIVEVYTTVNPSSDDDSGDDDDSGNSTFATGLSALGASLLSRL
jgi:hypothetical protein